MNTQNKANHSHISVNDTTRITPSAAKDMIDRSEAAYIELSKTTEHRPRPLKKHSIASYARDIVSGRWERNGETIKISTEGCIVDGNHRLRACVKAGVAIDVIIVSDVPIPCSVTIDTGVPRTANDVLRMCGTPNASDIASTVRYLFLFLENSHTDYKKLSPRIILDVCNDMSEDIGNGISWGGKTSKASMLSRVIGSALFVILSTESKDLADAFFAKLVSGAGLDDRHPILHLRKRLAELDGRFVGKDNAVARAALVFHCWRLYVSGNKVSVLRTNVPFIPVAPAELVANLKSILTNE